MEMHKPSHVHRKLEKRMDPGLVKNPDHFRMEVSEDGTAGYTFIEGRYTRQ